MSSPAQVLVLVVNEVLEDARVFKTCTSLLDAGAQVTVGCTNPGGRPEKELRERMRIVRFPHPPDFFLKRRYSQLRGRLGRRIGSAATSLHEEAPPSGLRSLLRTSVLSANFRHLLRTTAATNQRMIRAFSGGGFDLVHCNDLLTLTAGCALRDSGAARELLYDSHEFWPGMASEGSLANRTWGGMEREMIGRADHVVTVNPFIAELLEKTYRLPRTPAVVMNCPPLAEEEAGRTAGAPVRVLYQGRLQAYRGLEELVLAFAAVEGGTLTVSGDGPLQGGLQALAESAGLGEKVRFSGRFARDEGMQVVGVCDIGVIPYKPVNLNNTYASPNKLFEYMMGGLALATSDLPFLSSVVKAEKAGIVFQSLEPPRIARDLNRLIDDPRSLQRFRAAARAAARERYHWDRQFAHYPWRP